MIVKKNFHPLKVLTYTWPPMLFSTGLALLVFGLHTGAGFTQIALPFMIVGVLGTALAIFLGFRNSSSYQRWWEARQLWGGIVNSSRIFSRLVCTFADSHQHQANYQKKRSEAFKKSLVYKQIAWVHALRFHLREQPLGQELKPLVSEAEFTRLAQAQNKPNYLQKMMGQQIYTAMADGTLGGFDSFQMEGQLAALANYQGSCERIKNTPMPRQYHYFTRVFLYVFILFFPLGLVGALAKMGIAWVVVPVTVVVAFVFSAIERTGAVNEDPFENRIQDVPLTTLCNTIERDLRETLEETQLPPKLVPVDGFLF
ncbi:bestrophin family protein [uncultured Microscilla sp.]|uniref:bestrophin family protein n=1 Tax=uncultured Microscilla sp. TaxID=432653 RepID=UPI00260D06C0|nr:bestrophin family ion channel [uncultured Microscilla sp.]